MNKTEIIINKNCWLDYTTKEQLDELAKLKGVEKIIGLPDLHAGKIPIGIAVKSKDIIYPHIIGGDIGCGMRLIKTGVLKKKYKMDRWIKKLEKLKSIDDIKLIERRFNRCPIYNLGTIGSGNHFAEFQTLNEIYDEEEFLKLNFSKEDILLLIHSGSRGYGERILKKYDDINGVDPNSEIGLKYIKEHDQALFWAEKNRELVAEKLIEYLGFSYDGECIIDCFHNFIEKNEDYYIHRKGATSSKNGIVVIPGTRGSLTYLVSPKNDTSISLDSLSHGAGRKWPRKICKSKLEDNYSLQDIKTTALKSRVICHDLDLIYQEAPKAYKNIEDIINSLLEYDLINVVATLKPLITYKG